MMQAMKLVEKGLVPDALIRWGIRRLLKVRLRQEDKGSVEAQTRGEAFRPHLHPQGACLPF